jgi:hypothetical protein
MFLENLVVGLIDLERSEYKNLLHVIIVILHHTYAGHCPLSEVCLFCWNNFDVVH